MIGFVLEVVENTMGANLYGRYTGEQGAAAKVVTSTVNLPTLLLLPFDYWFDILVMSSMETCFERMKQLTSS